jgi:hypothetical protein
VLKQRAEPTHPRVASPMEGLGATYAAVAAPGTPHPATAEGAAAAAIRRGDFTFTRKLPPPAAVPGWVDSGRDAAISMPSSLHLQLLMPPLGWQLGMAVPASIEEVLAQFQDVLNLKGDMQCTSDAVAHLPMASKFRRLDAEKLSTAKREFLALEQPGIVRHSNSPWALPLHMVPKQGGTWRPCGNYPRLNSVTVPCTYSIPNMLDFAIRAAGCTHFLKIDLKKGYHQVPMNTADIPKTAITTLFGLFEFTRMTSGMWNAGNTFQRLIDRTLRGMESASPYRDDSRWHGIQSGCGGSPSARAAGRPMPLRLRPR